MSFGACWEGLQRPPAAAGGAPAAPQQLTVPKDPLPELWWEVAGGKVQVNSHQPEDVAPQQVPDLHVLLQSRVLQQFQQQGETLCDLRREKESHFTLRAALMPKGSSKPEPPWLPPPSDTTPEAEATLLVGGFTRWVPQQSWLRSRRQVCCSSR